MGERRVSFLIVGAPRSGTTLVQRLASELDGVRVPPETHFFSQFVPSMLRRRGLPLDASALRAELQMYLEMPYCRGLALEPAAIIEELGGSCESLSAMFHAIVGQLAGPADVVGEKTPDHLWWWKPITSCMPSLRIVAVVRDPRSVVSSSLATPWAQSGLEAWGSQRHVVLAERWSFLQGQVARMTQAIGPDRVLVLRYEDAVTDPEGTRASLAAFLRVPAVAGTSEAKLFMPWETWKARALEPVTTDRITSWMSDGRLAPRQAGEVVAVCRDGMGRFGYDRPTRAAAGARLVVLGPMVARRRVLVSRSYRRRLARIEAVEL